MTFTAGEKALVAGVFVGFLGGIAGALTGGGETEKWEKVSAPSAPRVSVAVRPLGWSGLSVSIGF